MNVKSFYKRYEHIVLSPAERSQKDKELLSLIHDMEQEFRIPEHRNSLVWINNNLEIMTLYRTIAESITITEGR